MDVQKLRFGKRTGNQTECAVGQVVSPRNTVLSKGVIMRDSIPPKVQMRFKSGRARTMVITALMLLSLMAPITQSRAEEAGIKGLIPFGAYVSLAPIQQSLSSAAWSVVTGYDPRFQGMSTSREEVSGFEWSGPGLAASGGLSNGGTGLNQQVPFRNPAPAFSRNLIITRQVGLFPIQTEPHIAVDPTDPDHIVLGTIDYNFPGMSTYTSFDGGETWDGPNQVRYFREDFRAAGDPVLAFDRDGTVYMTSISLGFEEFFIGTLLSSSEVSSMVISKSTDGGLTWTDAVSAARAVISTVSNVDQDGKERGTITLPFLDKPWIDIGPDPDDPDKDVLYLSYTEFSTTYGLIYSDEIPYLSTPSTETTIRVVKSEDGGVTWSAPLAVSPTVLQAAGASEPGEGGGSSGVGLSDANSGTEGVTADGSTQEVDTQQEQEAGGTVEANRTVQGSQPKVMADGTVVVAYMDTTNDGIQEGLYTVQVVTSKDGGDSFSEPATAGVFREPHFSTRSAEFRYWGAAFPQLAVGPGDEIYILTTGLPEDKPTDDGDIYLMRSFDAGVTWASPIRLNADDTSRPQFYPSIDVGPDGVVHAMWGDMRDDPMEVRYNIYYSRSDDQGETWGFTIPEQNFTVPDTRVTDFSSNSLRGFPGGRFIGDYFSLVATEGEVYMVWADTRLGEFGAANQQIAFARQTAIESPELFLNPPSGSAGRVVDIQGFGFQPDSNVLLLVSGVIVSNPRTDEQGQFQASIYMPLTGEGPTSITAYDETGNVATSSFYTEFGFDTLQRELDAINAKLDSAGSDESTPPAFTPASGAVTPVGAGVTPTVAEAPPAATPAS